MQVFDLFDQKKNGVIEFEEFVHAFGTFHPEKTIASMLLQFDFLIERDWIYQARKVSIGYFHK